MERHGERSRAGKTRSGGADTRGARRASDGAVERCPGGEVEVVVVRERGLRRVAQAERGEAAVARDEADGEHAADRWRASSRLSGVAGDLLS